MYFLQCSSIPAIYHLIQQTDPSQPAKPMILGPACSAANEVMGEIAGRHLNITQVSIHDSCITSYVVIY